MGDLAFAFAIGNALKAACSRTVGERGAAGGAFHQISKPVAVRFSRFCFGPAVLPGNLGLYLVKELLWNNDRDMLSWCKYHIRAGSLWPTQSIAADIPTGITFVHRIL